MKDDPIVAQLRVAAFRIPTDAVEADGTFHWTSSVMVLVTVEAAGEHGLGYTYTARAAATLIEDVLAERVVGCSAFDLARIWARMRSAVRNIGRPGLSATAISAVDSALWDLKARLLGVSLVELLGAARGSVPAYGSGGFISYDDEQMVRQLDQWIDAGLGKVKIKIGADLLEDLRRVKLVRRTIGPAQLFVDANGAFEVKQALDFAERSREAGVAWFEEPVSSDDLAGLRLVRERSPAGMQISAGEYGYDEIYFRRMLEAQAVDVLQADATRCCGITGFMRAAALASAFGRPLSAHCAPALHLHVCCAISDVCHLEYFHDHVRIERKLFDGFVEPCEGRLHPDRSRPGNGLELRAQDASRFRL